MKKQTNLPASGRKLSLNKKTISNLTASDMSNKIGGSTSCYPHTHWWCGGGHSKNGNTCPGHNTCYNC